MKKVLLFTAAMTLVGVGGALADSNYSPIEIAKSQAALASGANDAAMREAAENVKAYERLMSRESGAVDPMQGQRAKGHRARK